MKSAAEHAFRQHRNSDTLTAAPTKQESSRTERDSTDADNKLRTWRESCDCSVDSKPEASVHASEKHRDKSCSKQARKGRPSWASNKQFSLGCKIKLGAHTKIGQNRYQLRNKVEFSTTRSGLLLRSHRMKGAQLKHVSLLSSNRGKSSPMSAVTDLFQCSEPTGPANRKA